MADLNLTDAAEACARSMFVAEHTDLARHTEFVVARWRKEDGKLAAASNSAADLR